MESDTERLERLGPWIRGETEEVAEDDLDWIWKNQRYLVLRPLEESD